MIFPHVAFTVIIDKAVRLCLAVASLPSLSTWRFGCGWCDASRSVKADCGNFEEHSFNIAERALACYHSSSESDSFVIRCPFTSSARPPTDTSSPFLRLVRVDETWNGPLATSYECQLREIAGSVCLYKDLRRLGLFNLSCASRLAAGASLNRISRRPSYQRARA